MTKPASTVLRPLVNAAKEAKDALIEIGNIALDAATGSEIFSNFPVANVIIGVVGFSDAVMNLKLKRNIAGFLKGCEGASPDKLDALYQTVMGDPRHRDEVPDTLVQLLIDSHKPVKAEVVGRLFGALSESKMSVEQFNDLVLLVISASVPALCALPKYFESTNGEPGHRLGNYQRELEPLLLSLGIGSRFGTAFSVSEDGKMLYECGFRGMIKSA